MTPAQIAEGRELLARATAGEWRVTHGSDEDGSVYIDADENGDMPVCMMMSGSPHNQDVADAKLIVAMKAAYPAHLDLCERVRALEEAVQSLHDHALTRIQDGDEMGARVWRIALEDVARETTAALLPTPPQEQP